MYDGQETGTAVFPAYAGMIRWHRSSLSRRHSVPRLRGDDPSDALAETIDVGCSPPTRG